MNRYYELQIWLEMGAGLGFWQIVDPNGNGLVYYRYSDKTDVRIAALKFRLDHKDAIVRIVEVISEEFF